MVWGRDVHVGGVTVSSLEGAATVSGLDGGVVVDSGSSGDGLGRRRKKDYNCK